MVPFSSSPSVNKHISQKYLTTIFMKKNFQHSQNADILFNVNKWRLPVSISFLKKQRRAIKTFSQGLILACSESFMIKAFLSRPVQEAH